MREATRRAFDRAGRRAVLGAGAPWIWNLATEHFPDADQIDRFHTRGERRESHASLRSDERSAITITGTRDHDPPD